MVDSSSVAPRRSGRQRSSPVRKYLQQDSDGAATVTSDSDSQESTTGAATKRTKRKPPVKRSAKRSKQNSTVAALEEHESSEDEDAVREENYLFAAILDADTSIDSLISDFLDSYSEDMTEAIRDLVNFVLRCCGTKQEITSFDVEDVDTIPETLTQLQDHLTGKDQHKVRRTLDTYPLVSKNKSYKNFRKQLSEFWRVLVIHSADKAHLYDDEIGTLFPSMESWLVSMSSSSLRAFRHTATTICLTIITSLVDLVAKEGRELAVAQKQSSVEEKKAKKSLAKLKTIQKMINTKASHVEALNEMITNYFDAVFVHRYRDIDAKIRSESIRELGSWMLKLPAMFFDGQYLRYLGWVLSDTHGSTRLEVVKALTKLYAYDEYAGSLRHFTERFKSRMIEIALEDAENNIRCASLILLDKVRLRGYLEEDEVEVLLTCVFDTETKVRDSASNLFCGVLAERENDVIDEGLNGVVKDFGGAQSSWIKLKVLVSTLKTIAGRVERNQQSHTSPLDIGSDQSLICPGRIRTAATTFLQDMKDVDFDTIAAYLLYDNNAQVQPTSSKPADVLESVLYLSSAEESILLEVLVACAEIHHRPTDSRAAKNIDKQASVSEALIKVIPKLLDHFPDAGKLTTILQLFTVCDLETYSRLRQTDELEKVLGTICDIFFNYKDESLLRTVGGVLLVLSQEESLNTSVKDKFLDLQDSVRNALLKARKNDAGVVVTLLHRLEIVSSIDDCILMFEDTSGGSLFDSSKQFLESSDERVRRLAQSSLLSYFMWKIRQLVETRYGLDLKDVDDLIERRDDILFILDAQVEHGNESAASTVIEFETIFTSLSQIEAFDGLSVRRSLDPNLQQLILRTLRKEMRRYARLTNRPVVIPEEYELDDEEEDESTTENEADQAQPDSAGRLVRSEHKICFIAGEIVQSIILDKMDKRHAELLLSNKGKLGHSFDAILKELPDDLVKKKTTTVRSRTQPAALRQSAEQEVPLVDSDDEIEES